MSMDELPNLTLGDRGSADGAANQTHETFPSHYEELQLTQGNYSNMSPHIYDVLNVQSSHISQMFRVSGDAVVNGQGPANVMSKNDTTNPSICRMVGDGDTERRQDPSSLLPEQLQQSSDEYVDMTLFSQTKLYN